LLIAIYNTIKFVQDLYQKYLQTKSRIDNPDIYSEAVLHNVANSSVNQVMDSILQEMKGKDVVFVYVCLLLEEQKWKATLDKFQLGGQHFFLSSQQSSQIRQLFEIRGIPFYLPN
jgi:hypothetical protein